MLAEFVEAGGTGLHLLGGEPLLRKDILTTIAVAREFGLTVSLTTNGTLLPNEEAVTWLVTNVAVMTISLDGSRASINDAIRGTGTFDRAVRALAAYRQARDAAAASAKLNVSHVLCATNVASVVEMIDCVAVAGGDEISITYLKPYGNALQRGAPAAASVLALRNAFLCASLHAQRVGTRVTLFEVPVRVQAWLRQQAGTSVHFGGDTYCDTAEGQLRVSSDGRVYPCFAATKHHARFGADKANLNIAARPLRDILASPFYADFQAGAHAALAETPWDICNVCPHFAAHECYPGCPFEPENVKPRLCASLAVIA
jgi:radical SAM protein with 4Fe4S-binding SPASM domain